MVSQNITMVYTLDKILGLDTESQFKQITRLKINNKRHKMRNAHGRLDMLNTKKKIIYI